MLKDIDACIFDLDGTLVDSMWVWGQIDIDYLNKRNIDVPKDLGKAIEGASMREVALYFKDRFNLTDDIDTIMSEWNDMAIYQYENNVSLKQGIKEFLDYLKNKNIKLGLYTSNSLVLASAVLKARGVLDYFDYITAGCSNIKGKPEPDGYLLTAQNLNVIPDRCLVFEDLCVGILAGKNANMKTCAVKDNYSMYQDKEKRTLADYYIEDYNEIIRY